MPGEPQLAIRHVLRVERTAATMLKIVAAAGLAWLLFRVWPILLAVAAEIAEARIQRHEQHEQPAHVTSTLQAGSVAVCHRPGAHPRRMPG
jgi:hypothetical protein